MARAAHERVLSRVTPGEGGCWLFMGATAQGYGRISCGSRSDGTAAVRQAHRVVYEALVGPIPDGLVIDHLCRNRTCVNPEHLEVVTHQENILRGEAPAAVTSRTGVCQRGHSMADAYVQPSGKRTCMTCRIERDRVHGVKRRKPNAA